MGLDVGLQSDEPERQRRQPIRREQSHFCIPQKCLP